MKRIAAIAIVISALALFGLFPQSATAAPVPQLMNYQGRLNDNLGSAVTGTKSMVFSLYSSATDTNALWTETQNSVLINKGIFNVLLGSTTTLTPAAFDNAEVWLGIKVDTDPEMTPRQRITSVGYALRAGCNPGDYLGCYSGAPGTRDKGVCKGGVHTCSPDGSGFGACEGEVLPQTEVCYNSLDEDCDGQLDTGCAPRFCVPDSTRPCYSGAPATEGVGACHAGTQTCDADGSAYGPCTGEVLPQAEVCNGMDDNCDGAVDNNYTGGGNLCITGLPGFCAAGTTVCQGGVLVCMQNQQAQPEVCDGLDNDCNGAVDENMGSVTCGIGVCQVTVAACTNGVPTACTPLQASPEICNGLDDNCNGQIDEGFDLPSDPQNCGTCGHVCSLSNSIPLCSDGVCRIAQCSSGFYDCDGDPSNGCEQFGSCI